ncbi:hypothetical protein LUZ60_009050 [Juncus effusus]|nr:hypothetical protein LUZ60_009050 [Juncus effusus]
MKSVFWLLFLTFLPLIFQTAQAQGTEFLLNCGFNSTIIADGRKWVGDLTPNDNFTLSDFGISALNLSINIDSSLEPLYKTARFFNTTASYNFTLDSGNYWLRLHFYPFQFVNFDSNYSQFDIFANDLKLVSKFNISDEISWRASKTGSNSTYIIKEYYINVGLNGLQIQFFPNFNSFAFINAIEILPSPNNFFTTNITKVGNNNNGNIDLSNRAIEMMVRLNVGGPNLKSNSDQILYRNWDSDEKFMFQLNAANKIHNSSSIKYVSNNDSQIAPLSIYETARVMGNNQVQVVEKRFNVSWRIFVDPNFDYLIRLHFCELVYDKPNQRIFRIYINNKTASENYDVFARAGSVNKAYFEDYFDILPQNVDSIWVQMGPDSMPSGSGSDALLNGLEIFKLSKNGNLAHVLDFSSWIGDFHSDGSKHNTDKIIISAVCVIVLCLALSGGYFWYMKYKEDQKAKNSTPPGWHPLALHETLKSTTNARPENNNNNNNQAARNYRSTLSNNNIRLGRKFTLSEIRTATKNFDESLVIGTGGFGKVYKGEIDKFENNNTSTLIAVKRANLQSGQGLKEFETEIEMLSKLRHRHLVSLIGYCDEHKEMILVYEFMANGTLRSHLYGNDQNTPCLNWKQRIEVSIGAAKGLHYLHTGSDSGIIHRDVKTTNILLDENFVAKMSDFGLSRSGPTVDQTHVSTAVKGSFGYLDPEYFRRQQLTQKSDVYSFGIVLFEVLCARPVIDPSLAKDEINLAEWALRWQRQRAIESIVDKRLKGDYSLESLKKFAEIAEKCLADDGRGRPSMSDVLWHLEYSLQLHDAYVRERERESFGSSERELGFADLALSLPNIREGDE